MEFYTRDKSKMIQGIAVLLMIFHHQFSLHYQHFSLINMMGDLIGIPYAEIRIAWFGKICVGLFAFVSGYGIYIVQNKQISIKKMYMTILKRIIDFVLVYYIVLIFFIPIEVYKCKILLTTVLKGFLIYDNSFSGGWWYVKQYIAMLLLAPSLHLFLRKKKLEFIMSLPITGVLFGGMYYYMKCTIPWYLHTFFLYLLIFCLGMCICRFDFFGKIVKQMEKVKRIFSYGGVIIVFVCAIVLRLFLSKGVADADMDVAIVPVFIFCISYLVKHSRFLVFLGEKALWLWLVSAGIQQTFENELRLINTSTGVYLVVLGCSVAVSIFLDWLYGWVKRRGEVVKQKVRVVLARK